MTMELLDLERLTSWLDTQGLESGRPLTAEPLTAGRSNVMFLVTRGGSRWVLRRPAKVAVARANDGMRREFRLLTALKGTGVPHPGGVALCMDQEVLGCVFYLMDHVPGVAPFPAPASLDDDAGRAGIAYALVDALADLHEVDYRAAGLSGLGDPETFHERQVGRWSRQLDSYRGRKLSGVKEVTAWLDAHLPRSWDSTVMHGDYHMMNVLISPERPTRVTAIVDWETATLGDPLLDLVGFCEIWCPVADRGWPGRAALLRRYATRRGIELPDDLDYYAVLYNFRLTVLMEGIYQRSLRDPQRPDQHGVGERALQHLSRATELLAGR